MWGEISSAAPTTTRLTPCKKSLTVDVKEESVPAAVSTVHDADDLLDRIAGSKEAFFKSQQRDEPDLTRKEKRKIAHDLRQTQPKQFLMRYGSFLTLRDIDQFETGEVDDDEIRIVLKTLKKKLASQRSAVKNRRSRAAQLMLQRGDDYFSESQMKARNPLLYDHLVGQYLTEEEKSESDREARSNCSLSKIILDHMDLNQERDLKKSQEEALEEFDEDKLPEDQVDEEEKERLKDEFSRSMFYSFIDGKDKGFDYRVIDENEEFDDLETINRDAEEKYFDED